MLQPIGDQSQSQRLHASEKPVGDFGMNPSWHRCTDPGKCTRDTANFSPDHHRLRSTVRFHNMPEAFMLLASLAYTLLLSIPAFAQESRATIIGEVKDSTAAVIAGAKVTAIALATNTTITTQTNASGYFELPYLLPGAFRIEVESKGFKKAVRDAIELRVSDRLTLDFILEVGNVADSVVVTGETPPSRIRHRLHRRCHG